METLSSRPISDGRSKLPGEPRLTEDYRGWPGAFIKIEDLQAEVRTLEAELAEVRKRPRDRASVRAALKNLHEEHKQRRIEALANALFFTVRRGQLRDLNALRAAPAFTGSADLGVPFSLEELGAAVDAMPEPQGCLPDKERGRLLRSLTEKRDKCIREIGKLAESVPVPLKECSRLVEHWRATQKRFEEPVEPHGEPLQDGPEREAWKTLDIKAFMGQRRPRGQGKIRTSPAIGKGPVIRG